MISGGSRGLLKFMTKAAMASWVARAIRFNRLIDFNLYYMEDHSRSAGVKSEVWLDE